MNRKLRNTILAFSFSGMALAIGLMAAHPVLPDGAGQAGAVAQATAPAPVRTAPLIPLASLDEPAEAVAAAMPSAPLPVSNRRYGAALVDAESLERAMAATVGFVVAVADRAKQAGTPADGEAAAATSTSGQAPVVRERSRGHVRSAIAVPYFSFARGTGRGGRS